MNVWIKYRDVEDKLSIAQVNSVYYESDSYIKSMWGDNVVWLFAESESKKLTIGCLEKDKAEKIINNLYNNITKKEVVFTIPDDNFQYERYTRWEK